MADASRYRLLVLFLVGLVVMALGQQQELNVGAATVAPQRPAATSVAQPAAQSQPAAPKLPQSYWQWKGQAGTNPSYSVIIPSHNTAPYITAALQSVANSISYFNKHGGRAVRLLACLTRTLPLCGAPLRCSPVPRRGRGCGRCLNG
jgi:hypothetical protein